VELASVDTVKMALRVLQLVGKTGGIGVSEIARRLGEPKSTIQRSLATLYEDGWIRPVEAVGWRRWTVTMKVLSLTGALEPVALLREHALPVMEELRRDTHETIYLMVPEFDQVVFVELLESPQPLRAARPIGARAPLHVSSAGKAILAHLPKAEQEAYLKRELECCTVNSLADAAALKSELELTARRGYGFSNGEFTLEIRAVAAAILPHQGRPVGAVSISGPATRLTDDAIAGLGEMVAAAARRIGARMAELAPP
jgi:IclR family acetate operon transcriptional repressor